MHIAAARHSKKQTCSELLNILVENVARVFESQPKGTGFDAQNMLHSYRHP